MRKFTCFTLGLLLACAVTVNAQEQKNDQEGYKFTDIKRLPTTSVKSQDRAGTCWSWSTISFLESEIMRMIRSACLRCMSYGTPIMPKEINTYG